MPSNDDASSSEPMDTGAIAALLDEAMTQLDLAGHFVAAAHVAAARAALDDVA